MENQIISKCCNVVAIENLENKKKNLEGLGNIIFYYICSKCQEPCEVIKLGQ